MAQDVGTVKHRFVIEALKSDLVNVDVDQRKVACFPEKVRGSEGRTNCKSADASCQRAWRFALRLAILRTLCRGL